MIKREKVIKGLEICYCPPSKCEDCPYHDLPDEQSCNDALCLDALYLLKGQEAVEPKQVDLYGKDDWYGLVCVCPDCKAEWMSGESDTHFCPNCGRPVKFDA